MTVLGEGTRLAEEVGQDLDAVLILIISGGGG